MKPKDVFPLIKDTFRAWQEDDASQLAAALSYYTIFSLAPLLVIGIALLNAIFGEGARLRIVSQTSRYVGVAVADALGVLVENVQEPSTGIVATSIAAVTLLFGASGVFAQTMRALDEIWRVQPAAGRGILGTVKDRFLAFAMVLVIGLLFLLTLFASLIINWINEVAGFFTPSWLDFAPVLNIVFSFVLTTLLFAAIYKVLPRVVLSWRDVAVGAMVTAGLFVLGKEAISFYIGTSDRSSSFGAAGSLVILLVFVYYSAQIFLLGAEFTKLYARRYGSSVRVESGAVSYHLVTSDEQVLEAVAETVPQEEVQLVPRPLPEGPEPGAGRSAAAPPAAAPDSIVFSAGRIVVVTLAFIVGLIIGARR
ncbi:MAG TPA: YihY/virulence factor BrkB family protein [Candidatus Sulfomarinibacteraceae bacterium]|nr:YihY/virulence factor BrkB family protein [Candidatus Sulfomarinibacteraceae bacterium]